MGRAEDLFEKIKSEGRAAIEEFILTRQSEELFLDFKRSADNGNGQRLHVNDRNNLAKAISGFGNSEGGVIVWGVDCSRGIDGADVASAEVLVQDVKRFVSWLEGAISGCTIPPHNGVTNYPVITDSQGNGFAVTYIPKSDNMPHQEITSKRYYIRAGSDFMPVSHDVLVGMFGRRPQPKLKSNYLLYPLTKKDVSINIRMGLNVSNIGLIIADDLFAAMLAIHVGGSQCSFAFTPVTGGFRYFESRNSFSVLGDDKVRLAPSAWVEIAQFFLTLKPPFDRELRIEGAFGCGNASPMRFIFRKPKEHVQAWYERVFPILNTPEYRDEQKTTLVNELLGIETSSKANES